MDKITENNKRLKGLILARAGGPGVFPTPIKDFFLARRDESDVCAHSIERPFAGLVIQGEKHSSICGREYVYGRNQTVVMGIDAPVSSYVAGASRAKPFLFIGAYLDKSVLTGLCLEMSLNAAPDGRAQSFVSVQDADDELLKLFIRLMELCDKPEQAKIRGAMFMRELHYLLLLSPHQDFLRRLHTPGSLNNNIAKVTDWIKKNFKSPMQVEGLARLAGMSLTSLHRHFKAFTGFTPLQYQKQLRLYEAQRIMLVENEPASSAAYEVGYESVTQFNREYKKFFGEPPIRDIQNKRKRLNPSGKAERPPANEA